MGYLDLVPAMGYLSQKRSHHKRNKAAVIGKYNICEEVLVSHLFVKEQVRLAFN
jgi:hypothetical protein